MFNEFKSDIVANKLNDEQLFQKYFIDSKTFFFASIQKDCDLEYQLKYDIARVLQIHINDIYIVGSGKTGFSMKMKSAGNVFDYIFNTSKQNKDKSDIDIAIVSPKLFEYIHETFYDWSNHYDFKWDSNSYYPNGCIPRFEVNLKYKFLEYLGKGWYRPDFAPTAFQVSTSKGNIKDVIDKWRNKLNRKVSYGIYKSWHYFHKYQIENINHMRHKIKSGDVL